MFNNKIMFNLKSPFIALLADVHSNLEALTAVLADIERLNIANIGFLGDAVGYGPDPSACLARLKETCDFMVCGNHDLAVATGKGVDELSLDARKAAIWTASQLSVEEKYFLETLPAVEHFSEYSFSHGSPLLPESFDYVLSVAQCKKIFSNNQSRLLFIGHSHIPTVFIEMEFKRMFAGHVHRVVEKEVSRLTFDPQKRYLINIGSVGQSRDGDCRAAYGVLNLENGSFELRRVCYDTGAVTNKMKRAGFSNTLIERLSKGV